MNNRRYPIGLQDFGTIRKGHYVYVDKTAIIYRLVNSAKYAFISRPRRFGKSLLTTTLESYFRGQQELFEGLSISSLEKEWSAYPVLHIDLTGAEYASREDLIKKIDAVLQEYEHEYDIHSDVESLGIRFETIIRTVSRQSGKGVVVLIDEYDKPLLDSIGVPDLHEQFQKVLQGFYSVLKSCDKYLRFAFLTGVSKMGSLSIFSGLNNLQDISMHPAYVELCGITEEEIHAYFNDEISVLAEEQKVSVNEIYQELKRRYDGYHFCEDTAGLYNPFSILNALESRKIRNYWFATGTPTYLVSLLKKNHYDLSMLESEVIANGDTLGNISSDTNPIAALFQSGYLTIKRFDKETEMYFLGFPNREVSDGFINFLLPYYSGITEANRDAEIFQMKQDIKNGNIDAFLTRIKAVFAGVSFENEKFVELTYRNMLYLLFHLIGFNPHVEHHTSNGRVDATLETEENVYIFEFKMNKNADMALDQISDKHYADMYLTDRRNIIKVGISFDDKLKNICEWKVL